MDAIEFLAPWTCGAVSQGISGRVSLLLGLSPSFSHSLHHLNRIRHSINTHCLEIELDSTVLGEQDLFLSPCLHHRRNRPRALRELSSGRTLLLGGGTHHPMLPFLCSVPLKRGPQLPVTGGLCLPRTLPFGCRPFCEVLRPRARRQLLRKPEEERTRPCCLQDHACTKTASEHQNEKP